MPDLDGPDLDATLSAAFDAAGEDTDTGAIETTEPATQASPEPADTADTSPVSGEDTTPDHVEAPEAEAAKPISAPVSWSAEDKARFAELPPDVQEVIARREGERDSAFNQKTQEIAEQRRAYEDLGQVLEPYRSSFEQQGLTTAAGLNQLLQMWAFANDSPAEFVDWFTQQRGITPTTTDESDDLDAWVDPETKALQQRVNQLEQGIHQQHQQAEMATRQEYAKYIEEFGTAKGDDGQPLFPHFEDLRQDMARFLDGPNPPAKTLEEAYEMAQWASPKHRQTLVERQAGSDIEARKAAAAKAERIAKQPRGDNGQFTSAAPTSIEDTLGGVFDRMMR